MEVPAQRIASDLIRGKRVASRPAGDRGEHFTSLYFGCGGAALGYYQAFELLPPTLKAMELSGPSQPGSDYPLNPAVRAYVRAGRNSLRLASLAADRPYCNWGHDVSRRGLFTQLPELTKAVDFERNLIPLAVRLAWSQGHWSAATRDLKSALVLAHRLGQGDGSIGLAIEYQTQIKLAEMISTHLMDLPSASIVALQATLTRLPAPTSAAKMLAGESKAYLLWLMRVVRANHLKHLRWGVCWWNKPLPRLSNGWPKAPAVPAGFRQQVRAAIPLLAQRYHAILAAYTMPYPQAIAAVMALNSSAKEPHPTVVNTLVYDLGSGRPAIYALQCRAIAFQAMMRAAVAYRLGGRAAFDKIHDPFGHGSLMLKKYPDRLVLRSHLNLAAFAKHNQWTGRQSLIVLLRRAHTQ